ncbi:hypothetical protein ACFX2J_043265 [Malus domestica]
MEEEGLSVMMQQINDTERVHQAWGEVQDVELEGKGYNGTQDSDHFEMGPIIAVISRGSRRRKQRIKEVKEEVDGTGREVTSNDNK